MVTLPARVNSYLEWFADLMDESNISSTVEALSHDSRVLGEEATLIVDLNRKFSCWRYDENLRELSIGGLGLNALVHKVVQNW